MGSVGKPEGDTHLMRSCKNGRIPVTGEIESSAYSRNEYQFHGVTSMQGRDDFEQTQQRAEEQARQMQQQAEQRASQYAGEAQQRANQYAGEAQQKAEEMQRRTDTMIDRASERMHGAAEKVREQSHRADGMPSKAGERLAEGMDRTSEYLSEHDTKGLMSDIEDYVKQHPRQAVLGALVGGFIVARMLR